VKKIKSVNIWQSYKQKRDCVVHVLRLLAVCWPGAQSAKLLSVLVAACSFWHCPYSMRSRVYVTVGCPSVHLSVSVTSFDRSSGVHDAGLQLSAVRADYIDRQRRAPGSQQQRRRSTGQ